MIVKFSQAANAVALRVRFHIIVNARIKNLCKYQLCMVSKFPIIWKQTVDLSSAAAGAGAGPAQVVAACMGIQRVHRGRLARRRLGLTSPSTRERSRPAPLRATRMHRLSNHATARV